MQLMKKNYTVWQKNCPGIRDAAGSQNIFTFNLLKKVYFDQIRVGVCCISGKTVQGFLMSFIEVCFTIILQIYSYN